MQRATAPAKAAGSSTTMPVRSSLLPVRSGFLQRKCACGGTPGPTGECEDCRKKKLQRKATQPSTLSSQPYEIPSIVHEVLRSPGRPLDSATRAFMEPRFGYDFSRVRVHSDGPAAQSAHAVRALAYTVGQDIAFGKNEFAPDTERGPQLLAHELAHTVQQRDPGGGPPALNGDSAVESSATEVATRVANGGRISSVLPASGIGLAFGRSSRRTF